MKNLSKDLRARIYQSYVHGRTHSIAPETIEGLRPRGPYLRKLIRDHFPHNTEAKILDLGCGHGALLHFAHDAGYAATRGVDHSPEQVAEARRMGVKGVEAGDLMGTLRNLVDAELDAVICFDVIEHFAKDELLGLVDEVYRVLNKGGRWILNVPNGESPFGARSLYWDITHELMFTRTSLAQLLIASGFSSVKCFENAPIPHGVKSVARWALWKAIRASWLAYLTVETGHFDREAVFSQNILAVAEK